MRVDPQISKLAGINNKNGLILVFIFVCSAAAPPGDNGMPSSFFYAFVLKIYIFMK